MTDTVADTTYFNVLGVSIDATQDDILQAYQARAKKVHPERKDDGDEEKYEELNIAFMALFVDKFRKAYKGGGESVLEKLHEDAANKGSSALSFRTQDKYDGKTTESVLSENAKEKLEEFNQWSDLLAVCLCIEEITNEVKKTVGNFIESVGKALFTLSGSIYGYDSHQHDCVAQ
eukprot:IDg7453t1